MNALNLEISYPPLTLYARVDRRVFQCLVVSSFSNQNLYRRVIRIEDEAYQILKGDQNYKDPLYEDQECEVPTSIYISREWILKLGEEGTNHRLP